MIIKHLFSSVNSVKSSYPLMGFKNGGLWMQKKLHELTNESFKRTPNFVFLGLVKYIFSISIGLVISFLCSSSLPLGIFLFIIGFYLTEVHFLFLFPLAIEGERPLFYKSILLTYKTGIVTAFFNTIFIAGFMLVGVLNFKKPLANWYKGCYIILFWYVDVRDR